MLINDFQTKTSFKWRTISIRFKSKSSDFYFFIIFIFKRSIKNCRWLIVRLVLVWLCFWSVDRIFYDLLLLMFDVLLFNFCIPLSLVLKPSVDVYFPRACRSMTSTFASVSLNQPEHISQLYLMYYAVWLDHFHDLMRWRNLLESDRYGMLLKNILIENFIRNIPVWLPLLTSESACSHKSMLMTK